MMQAGTLRHRVNIQRRTLSRNAYGEELDVWSDEGPARWAAIEPLSGRELQQAQQVQAEVTHQVRLRWCVDLDLTPAKRIRFRTRVFDIVSVRNVREANVELLVLCVERV